MKCRLEGTPLSRVLRRDIVDCPETRRYQRGLDDFVDRVRGEWDTHTGEYKGKAGGGRALTAPLSQIAFCSFSPLSRHRNDPELPDLFQAGLRAIVEPIGEDGVMGCFGLNGINWGHGWDVEGLVYGMHFCRDTLDPDVLSSVHSRFEHAAKRLATLDKTPHSIGSYGNQRVVWTLGLHLYGQILADETLIALSDQYFYEALDKILDGSGQVIEQQGPCLHYSFTAFFYAWLNLVVRGDTSESDRIMRCLRWFRDRHTNSLYPMAGPSTRSYMENLSSKVVDLLPAAEQLADIDPSVREWVSRAIDTHFEGGGNPMSGVGHGASPLIWAILLSRGAQETRTAPRDTGKSPSIVCYDHTHLLKRFPLKYVLVRQRYYQTHYNFRDYLPFSGVQTWAWADEPPIIHPTPIAPSTTQAFGLDTARQGVSHNWGGYGAGVVGIDGYLHDRDDQNRATLLVARYDWLWRVVVFTPASTVVVEFGRGGNRRTLWTLNRVEPAEAARGSRCVSFEGREGSLHTTLEAVPELVALPGGHKWTEGVRQLVYEDGDDLVGFALSDRRFRFVDPLHFADASGTYELRLDPRLLDDKNPGNLSVDTWDLAAGTRVV